jgi:hypothetical protein
MEVASRLFFGFLSYWRHMSIYRIVVAAWLIGACILMTTGTQPAGLLVIRWCVYAATAMSVTAFIGMMLCCLHMDYRVIRRGIIDGSSAQ